MKRCSTPSGVWGLSGADAHIQLVGNRLPIFSQEESDLIKDSSDFVGDTHCTTMYVAHITGHEGLKSDMNASLIPFGDSTEVYFQRLANLRNLFCHPNTILIMSFLVIYQQIDVLPWGLEGVLEYIKQNYGNPPNICVNTQSLLFELNVNTKSGRPTNHHSSLHDVRRVEYLHYYIAAMLNPVRNGSDTRGYFQWSLMDLYEFVDTNYTYGLYYVNFSDPERKRSPKTSALWYSALLKGSTVSSQVLKNLSVTSSPGFASQ
ncbi:unnamed protein product [Thlaspi arvense]|uniref:Uncharacterized protein n=1 Tax=Thlaspi arvense TaxID=13288 RepID=A0AAU9RXL4_THLAR|nr:unnamed protein product [Thlaspi arvense]